MAELKKLKRDRIIWNAKVDILELGEAVRKRALPEGTIIMLGRPFFERCGKREVIEYYQQEGYPVFVDAKIIGEPDECLEIAAEYLKYEPFMLSIMAAACTGGQLWRWPGGSDTLKKIVSACCGAPSVPCLIFGLKDKVSGLCAEEYGRGPNSQTMQYMRIIRDIAITNVCATFSQEATIRSNPLYAYIDVNVYDPGEDRWSAVLRERPNAGMIQNRLILSDALTEPGGKGSLAERLQRNYARLEKKLAAAGYEFED